LQIYFYRPLQRCVWSPRGAPPKHRAACVRALVVGGFFSSPFLSTWGVATVHAFYSLFNVSRLLEGAALVAGELVGII